MIVSVTYNNIISQYAKAQLVVMKGYLLFDITQLFVQLFQSHHVFDFSLHLSNLFVYILHVHDEIIR
jgi:hypothetical protein